MYDAHTWRIYHLNIDFFTDKYSCLLGYRSEPMWLFDADHGLFNAKQCESGKVFKYILLFQNTLKWEKVQGTALNLCVFIVLAIMVSPDLAEMLAQSF